MFRTDFNHYLQSFDSSVLTSFMKAVSFMGTIYMILFVMLVVTSGFHFKKGIILINIVGWTALFTIAAKGYYDYPRPLAVDATLQSYGADISQIDYSYMQPNGFFEGFSEELLTIVRNSEVGRYGFPSGHVLLISSLWLGIVILFRRRVMGIVSAILILLTMLSRTYLGVHYLGDVIGGLIFALLLFTIFHFSLKRTSFIKSSVLNKGAYLLLLSPLVLLLFIGVLPGFQGGALIGLNLAYLLITLRDGDPELARGTVKRVLNVIIFIILYFSMYIGIRLLPIGSNGWLPVLLFAIANFIVLLVFYTVGRKFNFYSLSSKKIFQ